AEVQSILSELARADPTFRAAARPMFSRPAYELSADHMLPHRLAAAVEAVGSPVRIVGASFWTDAAVLGHAGTPSVLFGPGGAGLHGLEEHVRLEEVLACREGLVELVGFYCER